MISYRTALIADIETIVRLVNTAFLVELFFIERDRTNPEMVRELMEKGRFLLAEDGSNPLACIYVEIRGDRGYLGMLSVDPDHQRKGLGRMLVRVAEQQFRDAGCHFCDLRIVNVRTDLLPYYRTLGYIETGTAPYSATAPTKMPVHFIDMSKSLV
jgi:GNAT superfamily N-acetyltransferase